MKVIERATMPDGTKIQLEDWHEHNTSEYPDLYGFQIGAYPIAQRSKNWIKGGEIFRLTIDVNKYKNYTDDMLLNDFEALKSGNKTLADLRDKFWQGEKDAYVLGL